MKLVLIEKEGSSVKQDLIPYAVQVELANFFVKGCISDPDVHGFLLGPCDVVHLPIHY